MSNIAKIIWSGQEQVVQLPAEFQFDDSAVQIRRDGNAVILEPIADQWAWLQSRVRPFDDDAVAAMDEAVPQQIRPGLDGL